MAEAPIDLLRRFGGAAAETSSAAEDGDDSGEIELSLGLSLGGWYAAGERRGGLVRASSIASIAPAAEGEREWPLMRTCSLPAEADAEEVVRRTKDMQMMRRMEAKRKRSERRGMRTTGGRERGEEVEFRWGGAGRGPDAAGPTGHWKRQGGPAVSPAAKVQSGSRGSSSGSGSGAESYCVSMRALDISANANSTEANNPLNIHSLACNVIDQRTPPVSPKATMVGNPASSMSEEAGGPSKELAGITDGSRQGARIMMEQMPCVSTRGHGPDGKRVEGFLYKYGKGEEVRIVCVCHGSFLTPAEFVKHAGGGDVDHPLRHIVVNPSPSTLR